MTSAAPRVRVELLVLAYRWVLGDQKSTNKTPTNHEPYR
jgi:hypothetical protein